MTAIVLEGVGKDYGRTTAVHAVDLVIPSGSLSFLLGPSGCGKTTLLRMIAGFIEPTRGRIRFGNRDVTAVPPNRRNAGMVFQSYALWPHLSVFENVAFGLDVRKVAKPERQARVMAALEQVQMEAYAQRRPNELSGGQQQRVALARALVIRPTVLLLDEPLSNLDAKLRLEMRSEIRRLCSELRITTVYVTHDQKEALSMADEIAVLRDGRIVQRGTAEELYQRPATRFVAEFLGETNFLPARIVAVEGERVTCETPSGALHSATRGVGIPAPRIGEGALLSLRPEALRALDGDSHREPNVLTGRVVDATYLGEATQYAVDLGGGRILKVLESNPRRVRSGAVRLAIEPEDVVVLDASTGPGSGTGSRPATASVGTALPLE